MNKPSKAKRPSGLDEDTKLFQQFAKANPDIKAGDGISRTDKNIPVQTLGQKLGDWYGEVVEKGGLLRKEMHVIVAQDKGASNGGLRIGEPLVLAGTSELGNSQLSDILIQQIFPDLVFNKSIKKRDELIHQFVSQYRQYKIESTENEISAIAYGEGFTATMLVDLKAKRKSQRYQHIILFHDNDSYDTGPYAETPFEALTKHGMLKRLSRH